ncbi:Spt20 family-domain-containing protein [Bisporella sp. PMI_857]|nr:Spt20 family-domain-containing protein [Bisporella sp. PMI_857]
MAPSATAVHALPSKVKRPTPAHIQTNAKYPPSATTPNGGVGSSGVRSANRSKRDLPGQLLGRGQRNSSAGLRSASISGELSAPQVSGPQPYGYQNDEYILKKYKGNPPSLIIHLSATNWKFHGQPSTFTYQSPMKVMLEHLKLRTVPHDLVEFFEESKIPFYEGCLIVQIYDHKSTAPSQGPNRMSTSSGKTVPFSVHNSNQYLTPSSYVPYPKETQISKVRSLSDVNNDDTGKSKTAEQKDKENMPAPSVPGDGQRLKAGILPKKPKVTTIVLHPTPTSKHADLAIMASDARSSNSDNRQDNPSVTAVPTPSTAVPPPTPLNSMAPPAKRHKKPKGELDGSNVHAAEAQITLSTTAPLVLEPVSSAAQSAALLDALAHPMHSEKPPSPKTRKRTVAEMEADEALAADRQKYMLLFDERLSSSVAGAKGVNPAGGDGQAGSASFEPRFERFKTIENIRNSHLEAAKAEEARKHEAERRNQAEREREKLHQESRNREQEKLRRENLARQQEAHRRAMAAQGAQQIGNQGLPGPVPQTQNQHSHPQGNGLIGNNIHGQPQRFHQQQVSQAQASSPIVRNGTPLNHSSPSVNNLGNVIPMQNSTSSMGGSPPRPSSVVHQNHSQMGAPGMVAQRSQQSHAGTPRMINATPNMQSTPLSPMAQVPMQALNNGVDPQRQQLIQQQMAQAQFMRPNMRGVPNPQQPLMNGQQMTREQFMMMQAQAAQQGIPMQNPNMMNANYAQQLAAMGMQRPQGQGQGVMQPNMGFNSGMPNNGANMQQMQQQMQQMQQAQQFQNAQLAQARQAQMFAQQQAQAQGQGQVRNAMTPNQSIQLQLQRHAQALFQMQLPNLQSQYGPNIPDEVLQKTKQLCHANALQQLRANQQQRAAVAQQRAMAANGMQNGVGMPGQQGM